MRLVALKFGLWRLKDEDTRIPVRIYSGKMCWPQVSLAANLYDCLPLLLYYSKAMAHTF